MQLWLQWDLITTTDSWTKSDCLYMSWNFLSAKIFYCDKIFTRGTNKKCLREKKKPSEILQNFHLRGGCTFIRLFLALYLISFYGFHPEFPCFVSSCSVGNSNSARPHATPVHMLPWLYHHCMRSHCFRLIYRSQCDLLQDHCLFYLKFQIYAFILWQGEITQWTGHNLPV